MSPLIFLNGVILASAASISLGLLITLLLVFLLGEESPRLAAELRPLMSNSAIFVVMTALSAVSFLGLVRHRRWRWLAQGAMWLSLAGIALWYWPR